MIDLTQAVLVMVVTIITVLLVVIGIQVVNILKEIREMLRKTNKILDDFATVSESVAKPISSLSDVLTGASGASGVLSWLFNRRKKGAKDE